MVTNAEYYLKDAAGNTVGILDYNTGEWTWYVFGRERFAKVKPTAIQQPDFYNADHKGVLTFNAEYDTSAVESFVAEVTAVVNSESENQVYLIKIEQVDDISK